MKNVPKHSIPFDSGEFLDTQSKGHILVSTTLIETYQGQGILVENLKNANHVTATSLV